jgi:hypothetical protein
MLVDRSRAGILGRVTQSSIPSKDKALPYLPWTVQVAPESVPWFPVPVVSVTVVSLPSSKLKAATNPLISEAAQAWLGTLIKLIMRQMNSVRKSNSAFITS